MESFARPKTKRSPTWHTFQEPAKLGEINERIMQIQLTEA